MKKFIVALIVLVLIAEIILFVRLVKGKGVAEKSDVVKLDDSKLRKELADLRERVSDLEKQNTALRENFGNNTDFLKEKEQELKTVHEANEQLRRAVNEKFIEAQLEATRLDKKRKERIEELKTRNSELRDVMKRKDSKITQLNESLELTDKALNGERETTADLRKQLKVEKDKVEALSGNVTILTAERDKLQKELDSAKEPPPVLSDGDNTESTSSEQ